MLTKKFAVALFAAVAVLPVYAESPSELELDARLRAAETWFDMKMTRELVPAGTVALVHDQDIVWEHAYGFADIDDGRPAEPGTTFSICSISKLFTSIAVMDLVEEGRIDLDGEIQDYLPDLRLDTNDDIVVEPLTIRGLLSHASGLPREGAGTYWNTTDFPDTASLEDTVNSLGLQFTPYTNYQYSNIGMSLLGKLVASVSDLDYATYVETRILQPLGLETISTDLPLDGDGGRFATGYTQHDASGTRRPVAPYRLNAFAPAAGFAASVRDLGNFAAWQFRLLETGDPEVLERQTLRNMQRVHWMDPGDPESGIFGLGFSHSKIGDTPVVGHGGYCLGHRSYLAMDTKNKIAVTAMVNVNDVAPTALVKVVHGLASAALKAVDSSVSSDAVGDLADDEISSIMEYEGAYQWPDFPMGVYVIPTAKGELQTISLFSDNPTDSPASYVRIEGDTFRYKRKDDDLGATLTFERDSAGNIVSLVYDGYRSLRIH
ncbi:MAG: serine hydrolase domain-containing protein [Pseudomonadota bacterium]